MVHCKAIVCKGAPLTREATNLQLLTSTPDEFALGLARFLPTARDLLSLCLACPRFAAKVIAGGAAAAPEMLSWWRRRRGCGSRGAASRSAGGYRVASSRAGCV